MGGSNNTPMATSSGVLDRFSQHLAIALGSLQQSAQGKEIKRATSSEPLSGVQRSELDLALREMALETAQTVARSFVERLMQRLAPDYVEEGQPVAEPPINFTEKWINQP